MKITDVKVTPPLGPQNRNWTLLKIETDEGITGIGEWGAGVGLGHIKSMLIGADPLNINKLHYSSQPDFNLATMGRLGAGVEIALWDIMGKKLGVPMYTLLGGKLRDEVRVYCDSHSGVFWTSEEFHERWYEVRRSGRLDAVYEPEAIAAMGKRLVAEGFTAIKFDADVANPWKKDPYDRSISRREHQYIIDCLVAARDAIGPYVDLAVDLHGSYNLADALRICKDVEHLDLLWLEDPIRWEWGNVDALKKITMQTETPICTGEIFYGAKPHRDLVESGACDMLEPDIPNSGGAIDIRAIAELADAHYMTIAPHNMKSTVTAIAGAHICSTIPNFLALEYHSHNIPLWSNMLTMGHPIKDNGYIDVPDGPGLGIELNEEALLAELPEGTELWS